MTSIVSRSEGLCEEEVEEDHGFFLVEKEKAHRPMLWKLQRILGQPPMLSEKTE